MDLRLRREEDEVLAARERARAEILAIARALARGLARRHDAEAARQLGSAPCVVPSTRDSVAIFKTPVP